jgi:sulfatase maturation enzyme AslB (radical SAM superfamily)
MDPLDGKKASDTFCVIPWMHRFTDEQGFSKLCCVGVGDSNHLLDERGQKLNVARLPTDDEVMNSPSAKSARLKMMRGEWPKTCERCRQGEAAGAYSIRHHLNERFDRGRSPQWLADTAPDGTLGHPVVRYADIRLGNACNLQCRMCGPVSSRLWTGVYNDVQPKPYQMAAEELVMIGQNNWVKHESVEALVAKSLDGLEAMHFAGGEPLIIPEMVDVLDMCIASGRAGEIELSYNTNATVLPEKVTSLWKHFKSTSILCSVDGFGSVTEYIRRPSKWADIDRNIRKIDEHFDEWKLRWAAMSVTVQISNVLSLNDLFAYLRTAGLKRFSILPQLVPLFDPKYLSIQALPKAAKKIARERLELELNRPEARSQSGYEQFLGSIDSTLTYMDEADTTADLADFFQFSEASDKTFHESWKDSLPELSKALSASPGAMTQRLRSSVRQMFA